jgi:hypothetical protein
MEINTNLCDPEFVRRAKVADFFVQSWDLMLDAGAGNGQDKVSHPWIHEPQPLKLLADFRSAPATLRGIGCSRSRIFA